MKDFERVGELLSGRFPGGLTYEELFGVLIDDFLKRKEYMCRRSRRALGSAKSEALCARRILARLIGAGFSLSRE